MSKILVIGSMNMDLVVKTNEIPKIGETVLGNSIAEIPGGKGANQAVAMAKLGCNVTFLGKVGNDSFGSQLIASIKAAGVNTDYVQVADDSTGIAIINVDMEGNNNIVVIPGANWTVDIEYLRENKSVFDKVDAVLFQLEIPIETVKEGLKMAKEHNKTTILNPAPALTLDNDTIKNVDILIPNEHELGRMSNIDVVDKASMKRAANKLISKGVKKVIVTLGSKGVFYIDDHNQREYEAFKVDVTDTTAAGDSFIGGFTSSFLKEQNIEKAIEFGQMTAALSIQKFGAQSSLPTMDEVKEFRNTILVKD